MGRGFSWEGCLQAWLVRQVLRWEAGVHSACLELVHPLGLGLGMVLGGR